MSGVLKTVAVQAALVAAVRIDDEEDPMRMAVDQEIEAPIEDEAGLLEADPTGNAQCPCVNVDLSSKTVPGGLKVTIQGTNVVYPTGLGSACRDWDAGRYPGACTTRNEPWCAQKWCYVDPCNCNIAGALPKMATYLTDVQRNGKPLYLSYATCGSSDLSPGRNSTKMEIDTVCGVSAVVSAAPPMPTVAASRPYPLPPVPQPEPQIDMSPLGPVRDMENRERQRQLQSIQRATNDRMTKMQSRHEADLSDANIATREAVEADEAIGKAADSKIAAMKFAQDKLEGDARAARKQDIAQLKSFKEEARGREDKARMDMQNADKYSLARAQADAEVEEAAEAAVKRKDAAEREIMRLTLKQNNLRAENEQIREEAAETLKKAQEKNAREMAKSRELLGEAEKAAAAEKELARKKVADVEGELTTAESFGDKDMMKSVQRGRAAEDAAVNKERVLKSENADNLRGALADGEDQVRQEMEDASDAVYTANNEAQAEIDRSIQRRTSTQRLMAELATAAQEEQSQSMRDNQATIVSSRKEADMEAKNGADSIRAAQEQANKQAKDANSAQSAEEATQAQVDAKVQDAKAGVKQASKRLAENEESAVSAERYAEQAELEASDRIQKANKDANNQVEAVSEQLESRKELEDEAAAEASRASSEAQTQVMEARREASESVAVANEKNARNLMMVRQTVDNQLRQANERSAEASRRAGQYVHKVEAKTTAEVLAAKEKAERKQKKAQEEAVEETRAATNAETYLDHTKTEIAEQIANIKENMDRSITKAQSEAAFEQQRAALMEKQATDAKNKANKDKKCAEAELQKRAEENLKKLSDAKVDAEKEEKKEEAKALSASQAEGEKKDALLLEEKAARDLSQAELDADQKKKSEDCKQTQEERATEKEEKDDEENVIYQRKSDAEALRRLKQVEEKRIRGASFALAKERTRLADEEAKERKAELEADRALKQKREEDRKKTEALQAKARRQAAADRKKARELQAELKSEEKKIHKESAETVAEAKAGYLREIRSNKVALEKEKTRAARAEEEMQDAKKESDEHVALQKQKNQKEINDLKNAEFDKEQMAAKKHAEEVNAEHEKLKRTEETGAKEVRDAELFQKEQMNQLEAEIKQTESRREKADEEMAYMKKKGLKDIAEAHQQGRQAVQEAIEKHEAEKKARAEEASIADADEQKVDKEFETARLDAVDAARDVSDSAADEVA